MNDSNRFSLRKRIKSFGYAINGIKNLVYKEPNARIHVLVLFCVIGLGIFFKIDLTEWIAITIVAGLVILSELFNTAVERLADFVEPEWNSKIGLVKDLCAGAVLVSVIVSLIVGGLIFVPKIIAIIMS